MKKLIALLAVLGILSLNVMALPVPSSVSQAASNQNSAGDSLKAQQTTLALQIAITAFDSHIQTNSLSPNENEIVKLLESEALWQEIEDIGEFSANEMAKLENLNTTSEEEMERIGQELNNSFLEKLRGSQSLSNVTDRLLNNQTQYSRDSLDHDFALSMTYVWLAQMYMEAMLEEAAD